MYVKISIISLFALLLIGGAATPSMVFAGPAFNVPDKYSPEPVSCNLPDEPVTFSVDKKSYQFGDDIIISGQVIPQKTTNYADTTKKSVTITVPKAKSMFITSLDDGSPNLTSSSTYDTDNASRMGQNTNLSVLDTTVQIDECGNFETSFKVLPMIFKNGFYVVNVKYQNTDLEKDIFILDEELQQGCFIITSYLSESGRCGDFKGDDSDIELEQSEFPEIILTTDKNEYLPNEHVKISGHITNVVYDDTLELIIESSNVTDQKIEPATKLFNLRGTEPTFSLNYKIHDNVASIGTYSISALSHLGSTIITFTVNDESIVTDFAAQQTMSAPTLATKKIIDKYNRITDSEISITLGEKLSNEQTLLPRVLQGSLFTAARGDESSVNIQVSTPSGECVIGSDSMCVVTDSTRKPGSIYELVQIDGKNYNIRYSGPDVRLEKFTIIPETSNTEIDTKNWNVSILKDEQPTKFYYKVSYVLFE